MGNALGMRKQRILGALKGHDGWLHAHDRRDSRRSEGPPDSVLARRPRDGSPLVAPLQGLRHAWGPSNPGRRSAASPLRFAPGYLGIAPSGRNPRAILGLPLRGATARRPKGGRLHERGRLMNRPLGRSPSEDPLSQAACADHSRKTRPGHTLPTNVIVSRMNRISGQRQSPSTAGDLWRWSKSP